MAPYRSPREHRSAPAAPQPGLVADMVQQFADPYALLRELVQNSMDAGARRIAVHVELLPGGACATSVADDGAGMTREIIEGPLLTLFSSSKEAEAGKIGKYGVGFVSVFALQPELVEVETWRDGGAWRLRLRGDTSYELEDAGPREASGTRVTLLRHMDRAAFDDHAARARAAVRRWCRHAQCAIELRITRHEAAEPSAIERIDAPLSVVAAVSVTASSGDATFVVGPSAGGERPLPGEADAPGGADERGPRFAGFYNRGLTLFETSEEVFGGLSGIRFKVMSPRFQHTLSRDNVRRDDAFWEALARVRELVKGPLRQELSAQLGPAAAEAARGRDVDRYVALLAAALTPPTALAADEIPFPLANPLHGQAAVRDLRALVPWREPLLVADKADALTEAVTASGRPIALCNHPATAGLLQLALRPLRVEQAHAAYVLAREVPAAPDSVDAALLRVVAEALARSRHAVDGVALCEVLGALPRRAALLLPSAGGEGPRLRSVVEAEKGAARWRSAHRLHLNVASETVALARRRATIDVVTAGNLLARAVLVEAKGPLEPDDSDRLLDLGEAARAGAGPGGAARKPHAAAPAGPPGPRRAPSGQGAAGRRAPR